MQTTVNVKQAFGIAGEIYDLTPYRVDSRIVAAPATFGKPAGISATGTYANMASTTYTTFVGIFVKTLARYPKSLQMALYCCSIRSFPPTITTHITASRLVIYPIYFDLYQG